MFLHQLNMKERLAFIQIGRHLVLVDDQKMDDLEMELMTAMANEMQVSINDSLTLEFDLERLAGTFKDEQAKRICFMELHSIGLVNRKNDPSQDRFVHTVGDLMGLTHDEMDEMEDWVEKMMVLTAEGQQLVNIDRERI